METQAEIPKHRKKLKVLISSFYFSPGYGSEAANGWHWTMQAASDHMVWVIVYPEHREQIEAELRRCPHPGVAVVYWEVPLWPRFVVPRGPIWMLYFMLWQLTVLPLALRLHRQIRFDLAHQLTINSVEVPGLLWLLGVPFVWGPVGGAQEAPSGFRRYFGRVWYKELLRLARKRIVPLNPIVRLAIRKATRIIAANEDTERLLRRCGARNVMRELDVGIRSDAVPDPIERPARENLTVMWAGVLMPRKGALLALDVVSEVRRRGIPVTLMMAGDGPFASTVDQRIDELDLGECVHRLGRVRYSDMPDLYRRADVFLFSSLHDTSGTVVLEAMAHSLPIVTLDQHGVKEVVTSDCGISVPPTTVAQTINGLADALELLYQDIELRANMGRAARTRVADRYVW